MNLEVIPIEEFEEHKDFEKYIDATKKEDIFFDFEYLLANDKHENGKTQIALFLKENELIGSFSFILKDFEHNNANYFDIITPYEYGGILTYSSNKEVFKQISQVFKKYCTQNKIISSFQRIDPLLYKRIDIYKENLSLELVKQNICVDLSENEDTIFSNFHKNNRRDIRYAIRNGVSVIAHKPSKESIDTFYQIYKKTMDGKDANQFYYFNESYFHALTSFPESKLNIFIAYDQSKKPFSAALIFKKGRYSHYHLSGTNRDYAKLCGNNLLLYEVIIKMKHEGRLFFHLGGAASSQEGLYRFKKKFSKKTMPYYVVKSVFNNYLYNQISQDLIESGKLSSEDLDSSFFPLYRKIKNE